MKSISKNIVVLGAGSALGTALIERASQRSETNVIAVSRGPVDVAAITRPNVQRLPGIDLTDELKLVELTNAVAEKFTEPFAVVHSVGNFWVHKPLLETEFSEIVKMVWSQVITLFGAVRFLTPIMKRNCGGRLVAFSCNSVAYNYPDMSPFTASKAAVESFIKSYANEHSEYGITSSALALSSIRTARVMAEKPKGDHQNYLTPESLADVILDHILTQPTEITGNVIKLFKYSRTFYNSSYYDRNPRQS